MTIFFRRATLIWFLSAAFLMVFHAAVAKAESTQQSLADLYAAVSPSVVTIVTTEQKIIPQLGPQKKIVERTGSGFVITDQGHIMTAAHVVNFADQVVVKFHDGQQSKASVLASVPPADIALLKIDQLPANLSVAVLGDSDKVRIGDRIIVIGAPQGLSNSLSVGHISGRVPGDSFGNHLLAIDYLQTDAAINTGNSGGPMFDLDGRVIAISSRIITESGGSEGLGFGVSINPARRLLLEEDGLWGGTELKLLSGELAMAFNLPQSAGLLVQRVANGSFGDKAGLIASQIPVEIAGESWLIGGDVILGIDDHMVSGQTRKDRRIRKIIMTLIQKGSVTLRVLRQGKIVDIPLQLME